MQYGLVEGKKWLDMSTCMLTHCSCRLKYEGSKARRVCMDDGKQKTLDRAAHRELQSRVCMTLHM